MQSIRCSMFQLTESQPPYFTDEENKAPRGGMTPPPKVTQQVGGGVGTSALADARTWTLQQHWLTPLQQRQVDISFRARTEAQGRRQARACSFALRRFLVQEHVTRASPSSSEAETGLAHYRDLMKECHGSLVSLFPVRGNFNFPSNL